MLYASELDDIERCWLRDGDYENITRRIADAIDTAFRLEDSPMTATCQLPAVRAHRQHRHVVLRCHNQHLEHRHRIVGRTTALRPIPVGQRRNQRRTKSREVDDPLQLFQWITASAQYRSSLPRFVLRNRDNPLIFRLGQRRDRQPTLPQHLHVRQRRVRFHFL